MNYIPIVTDAAPKEIYFKPLVVPGTSRYPHKDCYYLFSIYTKKQAIAERVQLHSHG